jgi:response regulator RpfG family c-di-GMP phosphodiesterase
VALVLSLRGASNKLNAKLGKNDAGVITIRSIEQALIHLEKLEQVDAIWLDHHLLGKEDGLDFVKKFKANGAKWSKIPMFVVSNAASPDTVKSYTNAGISKYYIKSDHRLDEIIRDITASLISTKE